MTAPDRACSWQLTRDLATALGVPGNATRAVLTLEAGEPPKLELTMLVRDSSGRVVLKDAPREYGEPLAKRIAQVQFMVRLEPLAPAAEDAR